MRAAVFNPYWDTLGGGERYTASLVKLLLDKKYSVDIEWSEKDILKKLETRFNINLKNAKTVSSIKRGDGYDLTFWVSDGSVPTLKSRNNILHFQVPFKNVQGKSLLNKMKFFRIKHVVCNSEFTKGFIDKEYGVNSDVIYPPADTDSFKPKAKEKVVFYAGRFSQLTQSKNQHILVNSFKELYDQGILKGWKLVLAGGGEVGADKYIEKLRKLAKGYPISIVVSPSFAKLKEYYGKASIFWSAAGFSVNEQEDPEKVEHFGITLVEAMSAKCVPIVVAKGGHREIIDDGKNGFLWEEESSLKTLTKALVESGRLLREVSSQAQKKSKEFSEEKFRNEFIKIL